MVSWSPSLPYCDQNYPDYKFGLRIKPHDGLKIDQDLPYSEADNFSRNKIKNNIMTLILFQCS